MMPQTLKKKLNQRKRNRRSNFTLIVVTQNSRIFTAVFYALFKAMYSKLNAATEWHKKQGTRTSTLYMLNY